LVFGAEAKTRVWLVLDGDTLYVDRNANGDLREENERIQRNGREFEAGEVAGNARLRVRLLDPCEKEFYMVSGEVRGKYRQYGCVPFDDRPQDAPVLSFDGPLTMGFTDPEKQALQRGDTGSQITAWVGTPSSAKQRGATVFVEQSYGVPS